MGSNSLTQRRKWQPTPVLLPGKSHGWRSLVGCSPWSRKELDMTERLHFHFSLSCIGEGNGNPLRRWTAKEVPLPFSTPSWTRNLSIILPHVSHIQDSWSKHNSTTLTAEQTGTSCGPAEQSVPLWNTHWRPWTALVVNKSSWLIRKWRKGEGSSETNSKA